jgi:hypothetical protein
MSTKVCIFMNKLLKVLVFNFSLFYFSTVGWAEYFPLPKPYCTAENALKTARKQFKVDFYKQYPQAKKEEFERYFPLKIEYSILRDSKSKNEKSEYYWIINFVDYSDASQGFGYAVKRNMTIISLGQSE